MQEAHRCGGVADFRVRVRRPLHKNGVTMAKKVKKTITRREWTKDDVRQMKAMAKAKAGVSRIAKSLKRTPAATAAMASKIGVSLSMRA